MHRTTTRSAAFVVALVTIGTVWFATPPPVAAATTPSVIEHRMAGEVAEQVNRERTARGLPLLRIDPIQAGRAHQAADRNASSGCWACHGHGVSRPAGTGEFNASMPDINGYSTGTAVRGLMHSSGHRMIMMDPDARQIAVGIACRNGRFELVGWVWNVGSVSSRSSTPVVTDSAEGSRCVAETRPSGTPGANPVGVPAVYLRNAHTSGAANIVFGYGNASDVALACDWNGDGIDTIAIFRADTWHIRLRNASGNADLTVRYGSPGDTPVCGDWNGDGVDTIGIRRGSTFELRNSNSPGDPHVRFSFGRSGDQVVVGDWNGDGIDSVGLRRGPRYYLVDAHRGGTADVEFAFGKDGDVPVAGDWDGDGDDSPGIRRGNAFYLRNQNTSGPADLTFAYGKAGDRVLSGDWNGDHRDSVGIRRS